MKSLDLRLKDTTTLCFLDLEGTQFSHELIALGAVKVDIRKDKSIKKIHKGIHTYCKAKNKIGKIVEELTGITEPILKKEAIPFRKVVEQLKKYMGRTYTSCVFVTFGNHDLRILSQSLAYNLDAPTEDVRIILKHSFDFAEFMNQYIKDENGNNYSLANMLRALGVEFKGEQHNPLADALNLVYLYEAALNRKDILSQEYPKVLKRMKHLPEPITEAIQKLASGEDVSSKDFQEMINKTFSND